MSPTPWSADVEFPQRPRSRREFFRVSGAMAALFVSAGCTPPRPTQPDLPRVGYVRESLTLVSYEAFLDGLRELGWVDGQNVIIELRDPVSDRDRIPELTREVIKLPVDVFVANGPISADAAAQATSTIPIVVNSSNSALRLVRNIAQPEGNITGVATNNIEAVGKWVELLKETVPSVSHLAAVGDQPSEPARSPELSNRLQLESAARALGLETAWYDVRDLDALPPVLTTAVAAGSNGLVVVSGGVFGGGVDARIGQAVARSGLPSVGDNRAFAVNGGLLSHGVDTAGLTRRSAAYVDKLLRGAKPGDLPIELPTRYNIAVNLKAARDLRIAIPPSVLARAAELIE